jgi:hypothetical protein
MIDGSTAQSFGRKRRSVEEHIDETSALNETYFHEDWDLFNNDTISKTISQAAHKLKTKRVSAEARSLIFTVVDHPVVEPTPLMKEQQRQWLANMSKQRDSPIVVDELQHKLAPVQSGLFVSLL